MSRRTEDVSERELRRRRREKHIAEQERRRAIEQDIDSLRTQREQHILDRERRKLETERLKLQRQLAELEGTEGMSTDIASTPVKHVAKGRVSWSDDLISDAEEDKDRTARQSDYVFLKDTDEESESDIEDVRYRLRRERGKKVDEPHSGSSKTKHKLSKGAGDVFVEGYDVSLGADESLDMSLFRREERHGDDQKVRYGSSREKGHIMDRPVHGAVEDRIPGESDRAKQIRLLEAELQQKEDEMNEVHLPNQEKKNDDQSTKSYISKHICKKTDELVDDTLDTVFEEEGDSLEMSLLRLEERRTEDQIRLSKERGQIADRQVNSSSKNRSHTGSDRSKRIRLLEAELQRKEEEMRESEHNLAKQERIAKERELERREAEREQELRAKIIAVDKRKQQLRERANQVAENLTIKCETSENIALQRHRGDAYSPEPVSARKKSQWYEEEDIEVGRSQGFSGDKLGKRARQLEQWSMELREREKRLMQKEAPTASEFPKFSSFSGEDPRPKLEVSYEEWVYEVRCILNSRVHAEYKMAQAIRRSLRGQAKKVLIPLGTSATVDEMLGRLKTIFGNVASGESILQSFYLASQRADESVSAWGLRLEEILQVAIDKGHVEVHKRNSMLRSKFWKSLRNEKLKTATRIYYETIDDFEKLRREVRAEEHEMKLMSSQAQHRPTHAQEQAGSSKQLDTMMQKIAALEKQMREMNVSIKDRSTGQPQAMGPPGKKGSQKKSLN